MQPNIAAATARQRAQQQQQQQQQQGAGAPPPPATRGAAATRRGAPSTSSAPVRQTPGRVAGPPRILPRPTGPSTVFGPAVGAYVPAAGAYAPAPVGQAEEEAQRQAYATLTEEDYATLAQFGLTPEDYEALETNVAMRRATPGALTEQDMINFFREAGDPNDVMVPYPDGGQGPAAYSICAQAIANRWGGFINSLLDRMEQERQQTPTSEAGRLGLALTEGALTPFYGVGYYINPATTFANTVFVPEPAPAPAGQPAPAPQFVGLAPAAATGLAQAVQAGMENLMNTIDQVIASVPIEEGTTLDQFEAEVYGSEAPSTPQAQAIREQLEEAIPAVAEQVAGPLAAAVAQQAQRLQEEATRRSLQAQREQEARMRSMTTRFPAAAPAPAPVAAPVAAPATIDGEPALVRPLAEQQAEEMVEANIENQQRVQETAARAAAIPPPSPPSIPSVSALTSGPVSPAVAGAVTPGRRPLRQPTPSQVEAALRQAIAEGRIPGAAAAERPRRRGARTAPTTPLTGGPAAAAGYATAPPSPLAPRAAATLAGGAPLPSPLQVLAGAVLATGQPLDTQGQGVPTPPVVLATQQDLVDLVAQQIGGALRSRAVARGRGVGRIANALAGARERYQRDPNPQTRQVTETSIATLLGQRGAPDDLIQAVRDYVREPEGAVGPDEARQLAQGLQDVATQARAREQPTGRPAAGQPAPTAARARRVQRVRLTDASNVITANSAQIIEDITPDMANALAALLERASREDLPVTDELAEFLIQGSDGLAAAAVDSISKALNEITPAEAAVGQGVTPGTQ